MKRISTVLLIMVLVGSVAFAGFTGSASAELGFDFDSGDYGISNGSSFAADVVFHEFVGEATGDGDVYAEIKATLKFSFNNGNEGSFHALDQVLVDNTWNAKIVGDGWYVGIKSALDAPNFAKSAIDSKKRALAVNSLGYSRAAATDYADVQASGFVPKVAGVEVGVKDFVASVGVVGNTAAKTYAVYGSLVTPEFEVADGLKLGFGAAGNLNQGSKGASASVKGSFANDDVSASVAADIVYAGGLEADVAAKVNVDPVTVDLYFATDLMYNKVSDAVANYLSAKVAAVIDPVTLTVTGKDLINAQALSASAKFAATDELTVTAKGGYTISSKAWNVGGEAEYAAEDFTASADVVYNSAKELSVTLGVESDTLVNGATLYASYEVDDLITAKDKGAITVGIEIAF